MISPPFAWLAGIHFFCERELVCTPANFAPTRSKGALKRRAPTHWSVYPLRCLFGDNWHQPRELGRGLLTWSTAAQRDSITPSEALA
jgi:hypothetical protein